jgi:hypothetical protein
MSYLEVILVISNNFEFPNLKMKDFQKDIVIYMLL